MLKRLLILIFLMLLPQIGWAKSTIKIGLDADLSAVAKEGGLAIQRGAQMAIDEINENGGLLGKQLELIVKDHKGNPARGRYNIESLVKEPGLLAILGGVHTPVVLQELELIHKHKVPFLVPWAAGTPIIDNGFEPNFVFRVSVRDSEAATVMLLHAKNQGHQKVALLLEQTGWGRSNEKSMLKAAEQFGIEVSQISWFNWRQKSMIKELERIKESGATAVLLVANAPEGAVVIKEVAEYASQDLAVISHWGIVGGEFVKRVGLPVLSKVNLSVLQTYSFAQPHNIELNNQVLEAYRAKYEAEVLPEAIPGAVGVAHAYDLVKMLAQAVKDAESLEWNKIRESLKTMQSFNGLLKNYSTPFAESQDALLAPDYMMMEYNEMGHLIPSSYAEK